MGATLLPWWDDPAEVKPNEFERGVLTGMLLVCNQKEGEETPNDYLNVPLPHERAKIETSVTLDNVWVWTYYGWTCEDWYLHQKITYYDGTTQEYSVQLTRYIAGRRTLLAGDFQGWEFGEIDENGCIKNINWTYRVKGVNTTNQQSLKWYVPTTEPKRENVR